MNSHTFQQHKNDIRKEKDRVRNNFQREVSQNRGTNGGSGNGGSGNGGNGDTEYTSTKPYEPPRRPSAFREVSGLTGHRLEQNDETATTFIAGGAQSTQRGSGAQSGGDTREDFTSVGNILNQSPSYHFSNNFFSEGVLQSQVSRDEAAEFRKFIDNERADEERKRQLAVADDDLMKTNTFNSSSKQFLDDSLAKVDTTKDPYNNPYENTRYNKVRHSVVNIDSSHRNKTLYPNANNYRISLPRNYQHVKEVSLVASEIPNTDRVVRDDPPDIKRSKNRRKIECGEILNVANNNFYWINEEDIDQDLSCLIYNAPLTPGNYTALDCNSCGLKTIQQEIEEKVSTVNHFQDNTETTMLVDIDTRTNIVTILSIESDLLEVDPLRTLAGTNIITVTHTAHPFSTVAPNNQVTILNATSVGGVPSSQINGTHEIESIIDANSYEIRVNTIANFTATGGGGNVTAGLEKPIKLLFSNIDTIGSILGFPQQDSSQRLSQNITFINTTPTDLNGNPTVAGMTAAQITSPGHNLQPGDTILIQETDTIPDINGIHTVTRIVTKDIFEIGVAIKVVNNQTLTESTRIGKIKQSLDTSLTNITRLTKQIYGNIETRNAHGFALNDTVFIGNVVGGLLLDGNTINGIHTVKMLPTARTFGIEQNIEYGGNFGNAFVFKTNSTELVPITGIIPQNNGIYEPFPVEPIFTGADVPDYMIMRSFEVTQDINIDIEVDVDSILQCGNIVTSTLATQTFTTTCTCKKKVMNIWIRVGNPSATNVTGDLEIYDDATNTLLGTVLGVDILNESAVGTNFSVSTDNTIYFDPGTVYRWELTVNGGTASFCGNNGNVYTGGSSNLVNHDYEFRVYVSADVQPVSYYSIVTGRFDLQTHVSSVTVQNLAQNYIRSSDSALRFIKDAIVASNGIYRYVELHNLKSADKFYVRRQTKPYRTTLPIVSPSIIGIQTVDTKINDFQFDTTQAILTSTFNGSSLDGQLFTIETADEDATSIQNIYPQSNGYFAKSRNACDPSRQQCILCPRDYIYVRYSDLIDCGTTDNAVSQPFEGCYQVHQIFSDVSTLHDDIFDTANIIKASVPGTDLSNVTVGQCARLDTTSGVDGQNGTFNLGTIFFTPVTTITASAPQIWKLDLSEIVGLTGLTGASAVSKATLQSKYFVLPTPTGTHGIWFYSGPLIGAPAGALAADFDDAIRLSSSLAGSVTIDQLGASFEQATLNRGLSTVTWSGVNSFYTSADPDLSNHPTYTFTAADDGVPVGAASGGDFCTLVQISSIQDGAVGGTSTSPTADALCIRTDIPHLLDLGDAIYYTLYANNCPVSAVNTLPLFPPYASEGGSFTDDITDAVRGLNDTIQYVVPDSTDSTVFKIYGAGVVSSSLGTAGVRNVQLYYHKICGSAFNDFNKFFPNSYCGMIESAEHNVTESSNIYLGQTTTQPDINGFVLADETIVIDNNFLGWNRTGSCITTGNVGQTFAGEFVFPLGGVSTELEPTDITSQNDGVIVADNNFFGGEQVYFTNDTNINVGAPGELRDKIFTVAATNLTAQQFGLVDTSLVSLSDLLGNLVNATEVVTQTVPGIYNVTVPSGALHVDIELIGGGGGIGYSATSTNRPPGGTGGRVIARIPIADGSAIEPGDILQYTVGGQGEYGGSGGAGSIFGLGGDGGTSSNGRRGGGGGGYSSVANVTKNTILAVAGGGGGGGGFSTTTGNPPSNVRGGDGSGGNVASDGVSNTFGGKGGIGGNASLLTPGAGGLGAGLGATGNAGTGPVPITSGIGGKGGNSNGVFPSGQSGGGAGGGYYAGGGGGGNSQNSYCGGGGGGGSGYLDSTATATDSSAIVRDNNGAVTATNGSVNLQFTLNVVGFGAGHFVEIPSGETSHGIITVSPATNATFISSQTTGFPSAPSSTTILLSDNVYGDDDIAQIKDKLTEAHSFPYPAPTPSTTYFETDLIVTDDDIDKGTGILQNNKVDIISTSDARFPGINGLGWVLVNGTYEPITNIIRDSTGKIFPVVTGLAVNDIVHIISDHPNVSQDINGTHTVRYIDLGNTVPQFFELSDVIITNAGDNNGNTVNSTAVYFRTTITGNTTDGCITINEISNSCPSIIRATEHGFPIGSNISVVVLNTSTIPPIDYANAGVILNARVTSEDLVTLPKFDTNLSGNTVSLCNLTVVNQQNLFIQQQGYFSQERLSTNCGVPFFEVDTANSRTIVITETRRNLDKYLTLPITFSAPSSVGTTTVYVDLSGTSFSSIPLSNGKNVTISGHMNASPTIDGDYKAFGVTATSFRVVKPGIVPSSIGGTGGFVTFAAPPTIPGHGLQTGEKIIFEEVKSIPDINATSGRIWEVEVLDSTRFAIPVVLQEQRFKVYDGGKLMSTYTEFVTNKCPGKWCSNRVNMYLPDHGMADGDLFFLYGAEQFGGLRTDDLNTSHGEKRQNILTTEEKQTRKFATVIDANNVQFEARSFPSARTTGGGYDLCISAHNHNNANVAAGYKNYGFSASLQNVTCNGDLNAFINLDTEPYIWMTSEKLTNILDTDETVRNKFAKIQLTEEAGKICYNSFITSPKIYDNPDKVIDEIDIQFYRRDGKPFDFLGREHSFSLEFVEYQDRLLGTNIGSTRMKEDRGPVSQQGFVESTISGFHPEQNLLSPAQAVTFRSGSN